MAGEDRPDAGAALIGFPGLGDNNISIPPDNDGAVGPANLVVALNSQIEIQTRAGTPISSVSTLSFWSSLGVGSITDPRVIYDPYGQRWVIVTAGDPETTASAVLIGVSHNSDPTAGWDLYRVPVDATGQLWADFPTLGFNKNWIVVGINIFTIQGTFYEYANLYVFDKANLYAGGAGLFTLLQDDTGGFSMNPALTYDPNLATLYVLESWSSANGLLRMSTITGAVGSEVLTTGVALPAAPQPWQAVEPTVNFAPQLGSTKKIDTDDDRLDWTVYRNGSLWTAQTIFLPASGTPNRCSVQWWQIDTTAGDVGGIQQLGRIDDPTATVFYAYPSIGVNRENDALVGYSQFSAAQYAGAGISLRMAGDASGTLRAGTVLKAGLAPYFKDFGTGDNRWGDFSSTVVDPLDDLSFWTLQEYAATSNDWGTWWGEVSVGGADVDPKPHAFAFADADANSHTHGDAHRDAFATRPTPTPTPTADAFATPRHPRRHPPRRLRTTQRPSPIPTPTADAQRTTPDADTFATPTTDPTPTATPTPTPSPTATPTPSPVPTATPTPTLTIAATTLPDGRVGVFYHALLGLSGGTPPYLVYVSAGALPRGLALNTFNGELSGIPGFAGLSTFTVYATDRSHASASRALQISITPLVSNPRTTSLIHIVHSEFEESGYREHYSCLRLDTAWKDRRGSDGCSHMRHPEPGPPKDSPYSFRDFGSNRGICTLSMHAMSHLCGPDPNFSIYGVSEMKMTRVVLSLRFIALKRESPMHQGLAPEAIQGDNNHAANSAVHYLGGDCACERRRRSDPGRGGSDPDDWYGRQGRTARLD